MTEKITEIPKISKKDSDFLISRLYQLQNIFECLTVMIENSDILDHHRTCRFMCLAQTIMQQEIAVGFIAILSGNQLKKFLRSNLQLSPMRDKIAEIIKPFEFARHRLYAHMDFTFSFQKIPKLEAKTIENAIQQVFLIINQISECEYPFRPSHNDNHTAAKSLKHLIMLVEQDKAGYRKL